MLYRIVEKAHIEHCQAMGMCNCMCINNIVRWNNDHTKMIVSMSHECVHCSQNVSMVYSYDAIQSLIKNEESWIKKNI
jgi:hypothetical protein